MTDIPAGAGPELDGLIEKKVFGRQTPGCRKRAPLSSVSPALQTADFKHSRSRIWPGGPPNRRMQCRARNVRSSAYP